VPDEEQWMSVVDETVEELSRQQERTREWEQKRREAVIEAMRAGADRKELSRRSGFSIAYLRELAGKAGLPPRPAGRPRKATQSDKNEGQ
jgi:hypothetical protein